MTSAAKRNWYCVEAFPGKDWPAAMAMALVAGGKIQVWRPVDPVRPANRRAAKMGRTKPNAPRTGGKRSRFGRFFFIRVEMTESVLSAICSETNVRRVLGSGGPAAIPDEQIEFQRKMSVDEIVRLRAPAAFVLRLGMRVDVLEGPFAGFSGPLEALDDRGTCRVEVDIFGRPTPLILEVGHVKPSVVQAIGSPRGMTSASAAA